MLSLLYNNVERNGGKVQEREREGERQREGERGREAERGRAGRIILSILYKVKLKCLLRVETESSQGLFLYGNLAQ